MMSLFNAAAHLIDRHHGIRDNKIAYIDDQGSYTFAELSDRVNRFAGYITATGLPIESRVLLCLNDSIDFPVAVLGTIKAGLVPVMINPLLTANDFGYLIDDSRSRALVVSSTAWPAMQVATSTRPEVAHILVSDPGGETDSFASAVACADALKTAAPTRRDEACMWQYSSGSTGRPKGTIHIHDAIACLEELYPREILALSSDDITFSAAKLFFGYGFGNGLVFPLAVGATAILMAERPTPNAVFSRLRRHQPTVFYGVPTLYNSMLADADCPSAQEVALRLCTSAGEALPPDLGARWRQRLGLDIIDGIGSTEMLHIFLSNRSGDVIYGSTGRPLQGYSVRLVREDGHPVATGEIGELHVSGPTAAAGYWNNREKTRSTFLGEWVRSGDKFRQDAEGRYHYCGRSDDMLKVSGIYVSPIEVESALLTHEAVVEAAVIGSADEVGLIKPRAFVVLREGVEVEGMAEALKAHVKSCLAPYKYPRWFEFVESLPKTATGKIARYRLRASQSA